MRLFGRALLDRCFNWLLPSAPPDDPGAGPDSGNGDALSARPESATQHRGSHPRTDASHERRGIRRQLQLAQQLDVRRIIMPERTSVAASYDYCRNLARCAARNFYYGFRLLPSAKRDALCALYAFMREVDDISDEPGDIAEKQRGLADRRAEMDRVLAGEPSSSPVWPAFRDTLERFQHSFALSCTI